MSATISTIATFVPAPVNFVLMKGLLQAARFKLPYFNGTLPGDLTKNGGSMSVKWERINNLAVATTPLGELKGTPAFGNGRSIVTPTVSNVTVAIAKYGNAISLTEEVDLINVNTRAARFMDTMGANAGETLNTLMFDVYDAATNIRYSSGAVGGTTATSLVVAAISVGDIQYAVNVLNQNGGMPFTAMGTGSTNIGTTPIRSAYYGICHVDVEEDIRGLTGFKEVETYGGYVSTMPFEFGAVGGVRWCSTQVSTIDTSAGKATATGFRGGSTTTNDVYKSFIYGKEAIGTIGLGNMHAANSTEMYNPKTPSAVSVGYVPPTPSIADPHGELSLLTWKSWFAGKILNPSWVVEVQSLSSKL